MAADGGHVRSQLMIGDMYRDGIRLECDEKEAFRWYEAAARNNNPDAIFQVAMMCRDGNGTERDIEASYRWLRLYSEHNLFRQVNTVADSYSHFKNGVYDLDKGMKWYSVNANHNNQESEYQAALVALSKGDQAASEKAKSFLEAAAKKNHFNSANQLLSLSGFNQVGEEFLSKILNRMENIAKNGDLWAANVIGHIYADGRIIKTNGEKAVFYLKMASDGGLPVSLQKLGEIYRDGTCVSQDIKESIGWFKKGVTVGNVQSAISLVNMYVAGEVGVEDLGVAIKGLENMSLKGDIVAMRALGLFYYGNNSIEANSEKAFMWFVKASNFGDKISKHMIGEMYQNGIGINENMSESLKWFKSAADQGNVYSAIAILRLRESGKKIDDGSINYALRRLEQLARGGNAIAIKALGMIYLEGKFVTKDVYKAKSWLKKSALLGDVFSRNKLNELEMK
jgi:TPR repeat protein